MLPDHFESVEPVSVLGHVYCARSHGSIPVWASSPQDVFTVGAGGRVLRYDGTQWITQRSGTTHTLQGIWGSGPNDVFAVGREGTILHYDGTSWKAQASGTKLALAAVWGSGPANVLALQRLKGPTPLSNV